MSNLYCSECGLKLTTSKKAMPKYNCIIDVVSPHICSDEPVEFDKLPNPVTPFVQMDGKFVRKLNELQPESRRNVSEETMGDLRPKEHIRSELNTIAPQGVLDALRNKD
jgi:hypothetical protein